MVCSSTSNHTLVSFPIWRIGDVRAERHRGCRSVGSVNWLCSSTLSKTDRNLPPTQSAAVELPPPDTKRWTVRRKALVVAAVLSGMITIREVCQRYGLSVDEFLSWHNAMQRHGLQGLRTTKLQNYRYMRPKGD